MRNALILIIALYGTSVPPAAGTGIPVLAYHDIVAGTPVDGFSVSAAAFLEQMEYLRRQGYSPISLRTLSEAAEGKAKLPTKPIVLTFDDGLKSFQVTVLPALERYNYPAVVAVVTSWADGQNIPASMRDRIMDWSELKAVSRSPLVEILSHSDALHTDVDAGMSGRRGPAAITHRFLEATQRPESETVYRSRIRNDLKRSVERIRAETGIGPKGIVWPYGFYNQSIADEARALGMIWQLSISDEPASLEEYPDIGRIAVYRTRTLRDFERMLEKKTFPPRFVVEVDLSEILRQDEAERMRWLSDFLERIILLQADTLILDATRITAMLKGQTSLSDPNNEYLVQVLSSSRTRAGVRHIWLKAPADTSSLILHQNLAEAFLFNGVILHDSYAPNESQNILAIYRSHSPRLRCGTEGVFLDRLCNAFLITDISEVTARKRVFNDRTDGPPVYFRPRSPAVNNGPQLLGAIREARRSGARRVVVPYVILTRSPESLVPIAVELSRLPAERE